MHGWNQRITQFHPSSRIPSHWRLWSFWNASLQLKHGASQARTQKCQKDQQHHGVAGRYRFSFTTRPVFSTAATEMIQLHKSIIESYSIKNYVLGKEPFTILRLSFLTHVVQYHLSSLLFFIDSQIAADCYWCVFVTIRWKSTMLSAKLKARISLSGVSGNADLPQLLSIWGCNLINQMGWLKHNNWWDTWPQQLVLDFDHQQYVVLVDPITPNRTQSVQYIYVFQRRFFLWRVFLPWTRPCMELGSTCAGPIKDATVDCGCSFQSLNLSH